MNPGGFIQRVVTFPTFATQYLSVDGASPVWSERRYEAIFFASYAAADARASIHREATGEAIYAAVAKEGEHRSRPAPATEGFDPVRELPPKKRQTRGDRDRAEMQAHDIEALDEAAING